MTIATVVAIAALRRARRSARWQGESRPSSPARQAVIAVVYPTLPGTDTPAIATRSARLATPRGEDRSRPKACRRKALVAEAVSAKVEFVRATRRRWSRCLAEAPELRQHTLRGVRRQAASPQIDLERTARDGGAWVRYTAPLKGANDSSPRSPPPRPVQAGPEQDGRPRTRGHRAATGVGNMRSDRRRRARARRTMEESRARRVPTSARKPKDIAARASGRSPRSAAPPLPASVSLRRRRSDDSRQRSASEGDRAHPATCPRQQARPGQDRDLPLNGEA